MMKNNFLSKKNSGFTPPLNSLSFLRTTCEKFCMSAKNYNTRQSRAGFTLIELLVVIAIIAFLATTVLATTNTVRSKARDARRRADLKQILNALELYQNDNRAYPSTGGQWWGNCATYGSHGTSGASGWVPNIATTYMPVLPLDPNSREPFNCYLYRSDGVDFKLLAYGTTESVCPVPATDAMYDAVRGGQCTFALFSPGGGGW